jgi:hypothetical protein
MFHSFCGACLTNQLFMAATPGHWLLAVSGRHWLPLASTRFRLVCRLLTTPCLTDCSSVGRSIKLLLAFTRAVIPRFSVLKIHDQDFYSFLDMYIFQSGVSTLTKEGSVFLCRCYVYCTIVSAWVYSSCHSVQVTMDSLHPLSLHCTKQHLYKIYRGFLSMQACAAGYALTYISTLKLQLVSWTGIGLTAAKFQPMPGFCGALMLQYYAPMMKHYIWHV